MAAVTLRSDRLLLLPDGPDDDAADGAAVHRPVARRLLVRSSRTSTARRSPIEIKNDGAIVMVPKDKVARLRMKLAESGLPKGGGVGYEIFDKSDALGATSFIQNINQAARARRRARPHHPQPRPGRRPRACTSCCPTGRCSRATRSRPPPRSCSRCAARWSRSRCAPSAIWSPPRSTASSPSASRWSTKPASLLADGADAERSVRRAPAPTSASSPYESRLRERGRDHRLFGRRPRPCARADHRRFRPQPHHPDLGQIRSRKPRGALEPDARGAVGSASDGNGGPVSVGNELPGAGGTGRRQRSSRATATRTARPRKSSITKSRAPPRPR